MNLAILLYDLGQHTEARDLYEQVIAGYTSQLGADHTDTLRAKMNLANLLADLGQRTEARDLYEQVIAGRTSQLGADHTRTLDAKMNLAILLDDLGQRLKRRTFMNKSSLGTPLSWVLDATTEWELEEAFWVCDSTGRG